MDLKKIAFLLYIVTSYMPVKKKKISVLKRIVENIDLPKANSNLT